ncbi:ABC transporter permease [Spirosoma aerolatum]|uniref:ABC transporter permease n=1 Tax=Spirosoma aerolatum TaxID=1211326 RepID=UPI0009AE877A|nr:ABC transporter permease [Spirosoma aerolatum]
MKRATQPPNDGPPRFAHWLLTRLHPENTLEEVEGDLDELYEYWYHRAGRTQATLRYVLNVLSVLPPFVLRRKQVKQQYEHPSSIHPVMIRNYLKIAFRNLQRNKGYTLINVAGLALSMTCGILIFTLVSHHLSYDNFHANADRIYRIVTEMHRDNIGYNHSVPSPLGKHFRNDYTFGEKVARIISVDDQLITLRNGTDFKKIKEEEGVAFTEPEFFDMFNFPLLEGDKKTALLEPNTAIMTERMAKKYFGDENPIGKTFWLNNRIVFRVTGILKDFPANTDRKNEIFVSYPTLKAYDSWLANDIDGWGGIRDGVECYIQLRPGISVAQVEGVMPAYVKKYRPTSKNVHHYKLQPLADVHFNAQYGGVMEKKNLWVLAIIGLFLLGTACVNFINLATAQALRRSKEVGVRKVLGGLKGQLFWQFISETGLITSIGVIVALGMAVLMLPVVNAFFHSQMTLNLFQNSRFVLFIVALGVAITFFAGSYPGLILAGFKPVVALKGKLSQQHIGGFNTRRTLIIAQFAISQVLIIGMLVIMYQMQYAKQADLGFDKAAIVMVPMGDDSTHTKMNALRNELLRIKGVEKVSVCYAAPASTSSWGNFVKVNNEETNFRTSIKSADDQYLSTFGLELAAGKNLFPADSAREFLVNEAFLRKLNIKSPEAAIGQLISANGGTMVAPIVGVVKDFHDASFHQEISPIIITTNKGYYSDYAIKLNTAQVKTTMAAIEKAWLEQHPDQLFAYQFVDESIAQFYETEDRILQLVEFFSLIAIFIGCLGLYGLMSFMAAQKTKEIGIRKVLGSSVSQILWIFGKEFSRLIGFAFLIAAPIAWWAMTNWLQGFQFHVQMEAWIFIVAIGGTLLIATLTIAYQATRAALVNPVKSLRSE